MNRTSATLAIILASVLSALAGGFGGYSYSQSLLPAKIEEAKKQGGDEERQQLLRAQGYTGEEEVARESEARAALGALKDRARVVYQRTNRAPMFADLGITADQLDGAYFKAADYSVGGDAKNWWARCRRVYDDGSGLTVTCDLEKGGAKFSR